MITIVQERPEHSDSRITDRVYRRKPTRVQPLTKGRNE